MVIDLRVVRKENGEIMKKNQAEKMTFLDKYLLINKHIYNTPEKCIEAKIEDYENLLDFTEGKKLTLTEMKIKGKIDGLKVALNLLRTKSKAQLETLTKPRKITISNYCVKKYLIVDQSSLIMK